MFLAEMFGTMVLILLGDGVVANVLLNKSKGQNGGWIVITAGWAFAVMCGVFTSQALGGPDHLGGGIGHDQVEAMSGAAFGEGEADASRHPRHDGEGQVGQGHLDLRDAGALAGLTGDLPAQPPHSCCCSPRR